LDLRGTRWHYWKRLYSVELRHLQSSPNIIRVIKSRRIKGEGHATVMGRDEVCAACWLGNLKERNHLEGLGIDGSKVLKWIFK
jgi:hypothetical protein